MPDKMVLHMFDMWLLHCPSRGFVLQNFHIELVIDGT